MTTELSYRKSAIEGASTIGLMIALFDTLAGDLRRAAVALHNNDIQTRCNELNHATLVLAQLESWLDLKNGGESAQTLSRFYAYLRAKMIEASISKSAKVLEAQIDMILHVRSAWQQLDTSPAPVSESAGEVPVQKRDVGYATMFGTEPERVRFSGSA
ncbi:MAG: flagellar export chaperone FliS [Terracidiphilus sp.]|jgi:flagellar protein FliS